MKFWLPLLNSLALSFVAGKLTNWAKKRWGLSDPPRWVWGLLMVAVLLHGVYSQGMPFVESIGYLLLSLAIFGAIIGAFMLLPTRRHG